MSADWRRDVLALSALYLMLERCVDIPVRHGNALQVSVLSDMAKAGLIRERGPVWAVTEAGRASLARAVAAQDVLRQVEVFSSVAPGQVLQPSVLDDGGGLRADAWDPRFTDGPDAFDMRLAVISWIAETVSLHTLVFLQKLGGGTFSVERFWQDVEATLSEVDRVVDTAYRIEDACPFDRAEALARMAAIYSAGLVENQKRDGNQCSSCGIPLALFDKDATARGTSLQKCPCCPHIFAPLTLEEPGSYSCPKCSTVVTEFDARCSGCGATIDFSLPAGTVEETEEAVTTTETVWSSSYGYSSYGWLDPWDPFVDLAVFGYMYYDPWLY